MDGIDKFRKFISLYGVGLLAIILLSLCCIIVFNFNTVAGGYVTAVTICYTLVFSIYIAVTFKRNFEQDDNSSLTSLVGSLVNAIDSPIAIIGKNNLIIWSNREFRDMEELKDKHRRITLTECFGDAFSYEKLAADYNNGADYVKVEAKLAHYKVKPFLLRDSSENHYIATVWYNSDQETALQKHLSEQRAAVAYAIIDNASEMTQDILADFKQTQKNIEDELEKWASEMGGFMCEGIQNRYLIVFNSKNLDIAVERNFDIIDRITMLSPPDTVPVTVSIGVSNVEGSFNEKQRSAQNSLRSALQRGGALAVVATNSGENSYGGKTKVSGRQTRVRSRICRDILVKEIKNSSNVLIMGHSRPDFDSIASNIGIAKLALLLNKNVNIVSDKNEPNIASVMKIIDKMPQYRDIIVDPVYGQELLTPLTLVIITDASNPDVFQSAGIYENASRVIIIDHHAKKNELSKQVIHDYIDTSASSASEIVSEILELYTMMADKERQLVITRDEAKLLLAGILLDTQFFSRETGTLTFSACMFLRGLGAEPADINTLFREDFYEFELVNDALTNKIIYKPGYVYTVLGDENDPQPQNRTAAAKAAERLVGIEGIKASFVLYPLANGYNLSARSDGTVNVINMVKPLGGGGHFQSAGALLKRDDGSIVDNSMEACKQLIAAFETYFTSEEYGGNEK